MTVSNTTPVIRYPYTGPGDYSFSFKALDTDHITVDHIGTDGVETALVQGTDFSVTLNSDEGGTVTMINPTASGGTIDIRRDMEYEQPDALENQGALDMEILETAFDRVIMLLQQLNSHFDVSFSAAGFKGTWATTTLYDIDSVVVGPDSNIYACVVAHTSGTFTSDLANGKWSMVIDVSVVAANKAAAEAAEIAAEAAQTAAEAAEATATTMAATATTMAAAASDCADDAATSASTAVTQAGIATTQAGNAAASASTASTQASTATTQAGIATTQAGTATTQAGLATTAQAGAEAAQTAAEAAQTAAEAAQTAAEAAQTAAEAAAAEVVDAPELVRFTTGTTTFEMPLGLWPLLVWDAGIQESFNWTYSAGTGKYTVVLSAPRTGAVDVLAKKIS